MSDETVTVLAIEDLEEDYVVIQSMLAADEVADPAATPAFRLLRADRLETGLPMLVREPVDVVLLDLMLPDSRDLETFTRVHAYAPEMPVVVMTALASRDMGIKAVHAGAQDYLVKGEVSRELLVRSLVYAVERHRMITELELRVAERTGELRKINRDLSKEIAERRRAEKELAASRQQLRDLTVHSQTAIENERARLAREVHDELGQALTGMKIDLQWLARRAAGSNGDDDALAIVRGKIQAISDQIDGTIESVRQIARDLRPPVLDDLGLQEAIEWQVAEFEKKTGTRAGFTLADRPCSMSREAAVHIFRIFQEALTNVARHAQASEVDVLMHVDDESLVMKIQDDGVGIDDASLASGQSLGLFGMQERARLVGGRVDIHGGPNKGTRVTVWIPRDRL